jgi:hypothetical protein
MPFVPTRRRGNVALAGGHLATGAVTSRSETEPPEAPQPELKAPNEREPERFKHGPADAPAATEELLIRRERGSDTSAFIADIKLAPNPPIYCSARGWGGEALAALYGRAEVPSMAKALDHARGQVAGLDESQREKAAELLNLQTLPEHLREAISGGQELGNRDLLERLVATDGQGKPLVPDDVVLKTIHAHGLRHFNTQHKLDLPEGAPALKEDFTGLVEYAALDDGWLSPEGLANMRQRIPETQILRDDGFDTNLKGRLAHVFYSNNRYSVILGPAADNGVATHEMSHVLEGTDTDPDDWRSRGLRPIFGKQLGAWLVNETVAEHLNLALWCRNVDILDPTTHHHEGRAYPSGGPLLQAFCTAGVKPVDVRRFTDAYCENAVTRRALGDNSAAAKLVTDLHEAFPRRDVVRDVSGLIVVKGGDRNQYKRAFEAAKRYTTLLMSGAGK